MNLLAIDTASTLCAACVYDTDADVERGRCVLDIGKGHAEHLMGVIERAMAEAGVAYKDIGRIAVSIGPGSFTGVRVGVSTARGLALALKIPAVGVTTLEAIVADARLSFGARPVLAVLDAGRGEINAAIYDELGMLVYGPAVTALPEAIALAQKFSPVLAGSAARLVADACGRPMDSAAEASTGDIATYARLGAAKDADGEKPKPIYLREADAKPQAGFVLEREGR